MPVTQLTYAVVNSTTFKHAPSKELSQKFKLGNTILNYEVGYKPAEFNNDEKTLQIKHAAKYDTSSTKLENTETVKFGVPQVGPIRPWFTVSLLQLWISLILINESEIKDSYSLTSSGTRSTQTDS